MKNKIFLQLFLLLQLVPAMANAQTQGSRQLSLNEAIKLALNNNKGHLLEKARADEASARYKEIKDSRYPDIKASGSYLRLNNPDVKLKVKLGSSSGSGSGEKQASPKVEHLAYGIATATLPFFSGFRLKHALESAKYLEQAAKLDVEADKQEVINNTISAYANLYKAIRTIDLIKQNLNQQEQRVKDFSNLEQNGIIARNDLLKVQLQQSNIELSLLDAESDYKVASMNMALMLGLPEQQLIMPDSVGFVEQISIATVKEYEEMAIRTRRDIEALSVREKAQNANIKSVKGEYYPGLALTGGYAAADIQNVLTVSNAVNIGLGVQYNFASLWKTRSKLSVEKARLRQIQINRDMLNDRIRTEVNQAFENFILALKKIEVYDKAIAQASENYRITKNKHDNSLVTTTDLLDADFAQLQAKLNYAFSRIDAMTAYEHLLQVTGTINENIK